MFQRDAYRRIQDVKALLKDARSHHPQRSGAADGPSEAISADAVFADVFLRVRLPQS
jgi:hypothetical protein